MRKALILGIGNAQVDLIRYLKEEGWWVIGCGYKREGIGLKYVDQFEMVDITDVSGIEDLVRSLKVDLIYSIGSDLAMPTIAKATEDLGLPFLVNHETANLLQNKVLLRDFLAARDLGSVRYHMLQTQKDLDEWSIFPAIVKPADNQGQRGVFLANCRQEVEAQFEYTLGLSRSRTMIIEEYLVGPEISVNAFVVDGEVVLSEVSDRLVVEGYAGGIPKCHILPSGTCTGDILIETKELVNSCIRELSIQNGPVYFQIKLTAAGPRIIEIAPRLDGCHLWRLIKMVKHMDLLESSVKLLTGNEPIQLQGVEYLSGGCLSFLFSPPEKEFKKVEHPVPPEVEYFEYFYKDGEIVRPINGYLEKVGYYLTCDH